MKFIKLFLFLVPVLVSCAAPTLTPSAEPSPVPTTTNAIPGTIEGTISWLKSSDSAQVPITHVNLELNGHVGPTTRYATKTDDQGHFSFDSIQPNHYGQNLDWVHYATALRGDIWYDILFSSEDIILDSGETVVIDFVLKCP